MRSHIEEDAQGEEVQGVLDEGCRASICTRHRRRGARCSSKRGTGCQSEQVSWVLNAIMYLHEYDVPVHEAKAISTHHPYL
jgi:hypothetical protein